MVKPVYNSLFTYSDKDLRNKVKKLIVRYSHRELKVKKLKYYLEL